eukprot:3614688-Pyramimonas_sp.AAC.1
METPVGELVVGDLVGATVVGAAVSAATNQCIINPARGKYCAYQPFIPPHLPTSMAPPTPTPSSTQPICAY